MASLLDIAPSAATVDVGGVKVAVYGISAKGIANLLGRFPALRAALLGGGLDIDQELIETTGPEVICAIIAAGCGEAGNEKAEAIAAGIPFGLQMEFIGEILKATLPDGAKNVFDRLGAAAAAVGLSQTPSPTPSPTSSQEGT